MATNFLEVFGLKRSLTRRLGTFLLVALCLLIIYNSLTANQGSAGYERSLAPAAATQESLADTLYREVRVLCMVITSPGSHDQAVHVLRTWGRHCNRLVFMSTEEHGELEPVRLAVNEHPSHTWGKVKAAFSYALRYYAHEVDWFVKVNDESFFILENLRYFLQTYDTEQPIYFGCKMKPHVKQGYMHGGAGYVLSKEALRRFVSQAMPNETLCRQDSQGDEDVEMGRCLENVGVVAGDTRDEDGMYTFFPFSLHEHMNGMSDGHTWFPAETFYNYSNNSRMISKRAISFNFITPGMMYTLEYMTHRLRIFGKKSQEIQPHQRRNEYQIFNSYT